MADISFEIEQIAKAIEGSQVRQAILNGLNAINNQTNDATGILNKWFDPASSKYSGMDVANIQKNITQLKERNKNVLSGSVNLVDSSNYGYQNNGVGKQCENGGYNFVAKTTQGLLMGRTYTLTMLVKSPRPNFHIGTSVNRDESGSVVSQQCTEVNGGFNIVYITFEAIDNDYYDIALYNNGGDSNTNVIWCTMSEGNIPSGWSPSIKDVKGSNDMQLMALGRTQTNLAITSLKTNMQVQQLGKSSINTTLENIKLKKENTLLNIKLDSIGKQLVQLQLKNLKSEVK